MFARIVRALCSILAALGLHACDMFALNELKPGVSTGFDVRDRMGPPTAEWKNEDGSLVWEFARGPEGVHTYMMTIGPDNVLRDIRQVLTDEYFAKVEKGMSKDQVRRLLGKPGATTFFPLKKEEVWDWLYDGGKDIKTFFHVHFSQDGAVVGTSRTEQQRPG